MRYCILCGIQVADGVRGANRLSASLHKAFGDRGLRMVVPVVGSAMPDEEEHMAFVHGFTPISKHMVDGETVQQGPWVCVSKADGYTFGEQWERITSRTGRRIP